MPDLIQRRELLKIASAALLGLTTGARNWAMPRELVMNVAKAAHWTPLFFNAHQNETMIALTDLIIPGTDTPGAKEARVYRYLDLFLSLKPAVDQTQFLDGLKQLDSYATGTYNQYFVDCGPLQQEEILKRLAGAGYSSTSATGQGFFEEVKSLTAAIYYSTPEGYRELNKFGPPPSTLEPEHA